VQLAGTGIWAHQLRYADPGEIAESAALLDELGFSALWIPDVGGDVLASSEVLLQAAPRAAVATGVLNIWMHEPAEVAAHLAGWDAGWRDRFVLGLGVSHSAQLVAESYAPAVLRACRPRPTRSVFVSRRVAAHARPVRVY